MLKKQIDELILKSFQIRAKAAETRLKSIEQTQRLIKLRERNEALVKKSQIETQKAINLLK